MLLPNLCMDKVKGPAATRPMVHSDRPLNHQGARDLDRSARGAVARLTRDGGIGPHADLDRGCQHHHCDHKRRNSSNVFSTSRFGVLGHEALPDHRSDKAEEKAA